MRDGRLEASGHNWVEGQGSGPRIDKNDGEEDATYDAMGNKVDTKKQKKLTSAEARKVSISHRRRPVRYLRASAFRSSRRSVWHGRREARRSLTMSSKGVEVSHSFFFSFFLTLSYHYLCSTSYPLVILCHCLEPLVVCTPRIILFYTSTNLHHVHDLPHCSDSDPGFLWSAKSNNAHVTSIL
jgi:hypothetical protein